MAKGGAVIPYPETLPNLLTWFRYNTKQTGNDGGRTLNHDLTDGELITKWENYGGRGAYLGAEPSDAPRFVLEDNTLEFSSNSRYFNLFNDNDSDKKIEFTGVFTLIMRLRFTTTTNDALFGHNGEDFFRLSNNKSFRTKIGGTNQNNFTEGTDEIDSGATAPYYCIFFTRNALDETFVVVDGGAYNVKKWGGSGIIDADVCTVSNIGSQANNVQSMGGNLKDVLIYEHFFSNDELIKMCAFLNNQG